MAGLIYLITNTVNHKTYIGLTTKTLTRRWQQHQNSARAGSSTLLHRAIRKYGEDKFTIAILEHTTKETIKMREQYWIDVTTPAYNMTSGGDGCFGYTHSTETKQKMKEKRNARGPISEETRQKMSATRTGRKMPVEFGIAQSKRQQGQTRPPLTIEHRNKIRDSMKRTIDNQKQQGTWVHKGGRTKIIASAGEPIHYLPMSVLS